MKSYGTENEFLEHRRARTNQVRKELAEAIRKLRASELSLAYLISDQATVEAARVDLSNAQALANGVYNAIVDAHAAWERNLNIARNCEGLRKLRCPA